MLPSISDLADRRLGVVYILPMENDPVLYSKTQG